MNIRLSRTEAELLLAILQHRLGDYSMQIADADASSFRDRLRTERDMLSGVAERIGEAIGVPGTPSEAS